MRVSGSRENSLDIISGSSLHLFGQLVPSLAVPDLGPHLPTECLGLLFYALLQPLDALGDAALAFLGQVVVVDVLIEIREVGGEGAPQAPVRGAKLGDLGSVYRLAVALLDRVVVQQREGVADILLVELYDLELGEQQLCQRDRNGLDGEPLAERYLVGHPEGADQDVDLPFVLLVEEKEALLAVDRVESDVWYVAYGVEELLRVRRLALGHDPVQVGVFALEGGVQTVLRPQLTGDS